ncbi:hypothetical protein C6I20_03030 [Aeromicrobium sp. A1-2]|uniref:four-carbon acid sugar kinase family protein n=1 Tax=Aeromicrobium sp. A1-2 TaxID=2107713 RepID=UPI000E518E1D|nr:four-carbon acid sugar kinase family protein [Aeromicrobium sp. A1-2]AXT84266.1 hypothetical protein C6I20_03030 [Aeromicrobium sp. A1-2]
MDHESPLGVVRRLRRESGVRTLILDDDPTGSQAVHDVEVAFDLDEDVLRRGLATARRQIFALTNSRSLARDEAVAVVSRVVRAVLTAPGCGPLQVVTRGDSTLRGHVVAEVAAVEQARRDVSGRGHDAQLFVPAFPEAGRVTRGGVHQALVDGAWLPVGQSEFARDATFGFASSRLSDFLVEVSAGAIRRTDVLELSLDRIRDGGARAVADVLLAAHGRWVVPDVEAGQDLDIVAAGALVAESEGAVLGYRVGPSFVRSLLGIEELKVLGDEAADSVAKRGSGLVVIGSHTKTTNAQLNTLRAEQPISTVEVDVPALLAEPVAVVRETVVRLRLALKHGNVALVTGRELVKGSDAEDSLRIARSVSDALAQIVRPIAEDTPLRWVVLKGGITSHDVAVRGLGVRRARVVGQVFPGQVSMFTPTDTTGSFDRPFVIFPGNVGAPDALSVTVELLDRGGRA